MWTCAGARTFLGGSSLRRLNEHRLFKSRPKIFFFSLQYFVYGRPFAWLVFFFHFVILDPVFVRGSFLNFVCSGLWTPNMYL